VKLSTFAMISSLVGCVHEDLTEVTYELNGSFPGYVTTVFASDDVNRCIADPVSD
jgi:hypothetical protein